MRYESGELILENPEEIKIAVRGVRCLNATTSFACNEAKKSLTYAKALPDISGNDEFEKKITELEKARTDASEWLGKLESTKKAPAP